MNMHLQEEKSTWVMVPTAVRGNNIPRGKSWSLTRWN